MAGTGRRVAPPLPRINFEREFRRYLDCGLLARGFARVRCPECGLERLVAISCKGRLCPSSVGRRMLDIAAYLVDDLLPEAPYRRCVLTFPWVWRFRLAVDRRLFSKLLGVYLRTVFAWQRRRGRALGIRDDQTGAVTFVERLCADECETAEILERTAAAHGLARHRDPPGRCGRPTGPAH